MTASRIMERSECLQFLADVTAGRLAYVIALPTRRPASYPLDEAGLAAMLQGSGSRDAEHWSCEPDRASTLGTSLGRWPEPSGFPDADLDSRRQPV